VWDATGGGGGVILVIGPLVKLATLHLAGKLRGGGGYLRLADAAKGLEGAPQLLQGGDLGDGEAPLGRHQQGHHYQLVLGGVRGRPARNVTIEIAQTGTKAIYAFSFSFTSAVDDGPPPPPFQQHTYAPFHPLETCMECDDRDSTDWHKSNLCLQVYLFPVLNL